eukprot:CAMPEP_0206040824 /NCGR_PEP_ID=MMETSP1466-20131121/5604_1 /ASSEMBLY_ACC=CAM_ASM_001126 /TAXON_ID=44452 /ORGANISM="Pavlova gyrans, Strain CCMP608" /LENGTH=102 /DNA_ID=CAMNT_0053415505 /DNA_START=428 /DNA_END=736 /DNA_ORIENTATION=-
MSLLMKASSPPWPAFLKPSYLSAATLMMTLKSWHPPHAIRWTETTPSIFFTSGTTSFASLVAASRDALSLSGLYLHRHSRAMCSKVVLGVKAGIVKSGVLGW